MPFYNEENAVALVDKSPRVLGPVQKHLFAVGFHVFSAMFDVLYMNQSIIWRHCSLLSISAVRYNATSYKTSLFSFASLQRNCINGVMMLPATKTKARGTDDDMTYFHENLRLTIFNIALFSSN